MSGYKTRAEATIEIERAGETIELLLGGVGYHDPGRVTGPPENCYPPEREMDVTSLETIDGFFEEELTSAEYDRAMAALAENEEYVE